VLHDCFLVTAIIICNLFVNFGAIVFSVLYYVEWDVKP